MARPREEAMNVTACHPACAPGCNECVRVRSESVGAEWEPILTPKRPPPSRPLVWGVLIFLAAFWGGVLWLAR
jgi:hypothetical protein